MEPDRALTDTEIRIYRCQALVWVWPNPDVVVRCQTPVPVLGLDGVRIGFAGLDLRGAGATTRLRAQVSIDWESEERLLLETGTRIWIEPVPGPGARDLDLVQLQLTLQDPGWAWSEPLARIVL